MNPAAWGGLSALSLGGSDFASRFSSRAVGADVVLFGVLAVGSVILSWWVWYIDLPLLWNASGVWLLVLNGVSTMVMTLLLYAALARGPVSIVAPIVASHQVLVLAVWVALGVRPSPFQWTAMGMTLVGVVVVAYSADTAGDDCARDPVYFRRTLSIACTAALVYAVMVVAGQLAVPVYGEMQTLWLARLIGFASIAFLFAVRSKVPRASVQWWPLIALQGVLDAGGYLFLFAGSQGAGREMAAVTASAFGAVTTLLARFILKERTNTLQWGGITLVFGGIVGLSWP